MAKRKISFGEGGLKGFLGRHIEKLLFGLIVTVAAMMVWSGFSNREGISSSKDPTKLTDEATRATSHINGFSWDGHYRDKRSPKDASDLSSRAAQTLQKMSEDAYATQKLIAPPVSTPRTRRTDPDLLAVIDLTATAGHGALVKPTFRSENRNAGEEGAEEFFDQAGESDPLAGQDLDPDKFRPVPSGFNLAGSREGGRSGSSDAGKGVYFVSVTGLVPYREQLKIYQSSFLNASAFNPSRDAPRYLSWKLERSPVKPGSDERKWTSITLGMAQARAKKLGTMGGGMGGRSDQSIDPRAMDPALTCFSPPLLARDMEELCRHDSILTLAEAMEEMKAEAEAELAAANSAAEEGGEEGEEDADAMDIDPSALPSGGGGMRGGEMGFAGGEMGYGGGEMGGGEMGYGGGEMGYGGPPQGYGGEMGRQQFGGGNSFVAMGGSSGGAADPSKVPEFKMFRYIDLDVESGQSYVYRLKLYVEDPNLPQLEQAEPPENALEGQVIQRRKKLKAAEAAGKKRRFYRLTDYSDESNMVSIKAGQRLLAGPVTPARPTLPRGGEGLAFIRTGEEPTADAMALEFDIQRAADIPGQLKVRRGKVAHFKVDNTEVLRPSLNMLEKIEDHRFKVNTMVLDLRGGGDHKFDELTEPGEFLVMDSRGRLVVLNELDDAEDFESNIFPEKVEGNRGGGEFGGPPPGFGGDEGGYPGNFGGERR